MAYSDTQAFDRTEESVNAETLKNILRILCMLEKELNRIARRNYHNRNQYPEIFFQTESCLNTLRSWITKYSAFCSVPVFSELMGVCLKEISELIGELIIACNPVKGKKAVKKARLIPERKRLEKSADDMIDNIIKYITALETDETLIEAELAKALSEEFEEHCSREHENTVRFSVSARGEKSYIFPWSDISAYPALIENRELFRSEVVDKLSACGHITGHKPTCKCRKKYWLRGCRSSKRKPVTEGGKQHEFPIRMIECADCGRERAGFCGQKLKKIIVKA